MASSSIPTGVAVKFWVPNLGAHVPVSLTTGLPDYSEYVKSGLWLPRRRLRICGGSGEVAYCPDGDRSWPATFPVRNMKVYDTFCEMQGVRPEQAINPVSALEVLEGQVALVHHIMAFEEANPAVHILSPRQKWKAGFLAYFLGAVSKGQLEVMKKLGDESYAASLGRSEPVKAWSTNYAAAVTSLWAGSTMLCSRTLTRSSRPFAGRRARFWDSFLGIPRRGSRFMFSYVACTMTTSRASTGTSACRQCRGTHVCPLPQIQSLLASL